LKADLTLPAELVDLIADKVIERLKPIIGRNSKHDAEDTLMTIDETAEFLKTSKGQIYQWVNSSQHGLGDFPYLKAGKLLRFSKSAILKWLENR
jgi:excisionase family DNA binding protein